MESYVFEVCDDLGASPWRTFRDIVVPLGAPGIFAGSLFIFTNGIGQAIIPDFLGGPGAANGGILVLNAIQAIDFPLAMAISAVMMGMMILLILVGNWLFDLRRILAPIQR